MKYRIVFEFEYRKAVFDFDDIEEAGRFATSIIYHLNKSNTDYEKSSIRMEFIDEEDQTDGDE